MPVQSMPHCAIAQAQLVALLKSSRYALAVAANSATGFGDPSLRRRTGATISIAGAFFVPAFLLYGGCARETFGSAGFLLTRFANLRTAATHIRLATIRGSFHLRRSSTHARTQSVQNPRCCPSRNGSRRSSRQLKPPHSPLSLQLTHGKSPRPGNHRGCAMSPDKSPAKTAGVSGFAPMDSGGTPLFSVAPGVCVEDALEHASCLMSCINQLTLSAATDDNTGHATWCAHYMGEMVKAIIDDVATGLFLSRDHT